jgi:hypothetical protein
MISKRIIKQGEIIIIILFLGDFVGSFNFANKDDDA